MIEPYTAAALRALHRAELRARLRGAHRVEPADLLAALVDEPESQASTLLSEHGLAGEQLLAALGANALPVDEEGNTIEQAPDEPAEAVPHSDLLRAAIGDATMHARAVEHGRSVGTEHLLAGLIAARGPLAELLAGAGLALEQLAGQFASETATEIAPLPIPDDMPPLDLAGQSDAVDLGRILDASANRAREGLRVVEDFVRFALDEPMLTRRLKDVRHRLAEALRGFDPQLLIGSRDTREDVGTHIMTAAEQTRENPRAVLAANFRRTTEALRSLEEYSKLVDVWLSGRFEVLRYDLYTLEKLTLTAIAAHQALGDARLCLLVGGQATLGELTWLVGEALAGGVQVVQLREKNRPDRELLTRAREVRILTAQARARFIMNDRPDLARLASADGLHLGQDDVSLRDARRVVGPQALLGRSTHNLAQLEQAVVEGASYLGVGPVFPSTTKPMLDLAGLAFVRQAADATTIPWFAIGGITLENLEEVLAAGASRVAVSAAILSAERPRQAAASFRKQLDEAAAGQ
jgi:thiamine-phosphate pyrophosphorylase